MLKSISLKNFQIHQSLVKEFSADAPNVITGPSDSGKTSIFRAITWLIYDTPKTKTVIRVGSTQVSVTVESESGSKVSRTSTVSRNKKGELQVNNSIRFVYADGSYRDYKKFKYTGDDSISHQIRDFLGISSVTMESGRVFDLNIQNQLDPPFLLSESPFDRAQTIGAIGGITILDSAIDSMAYKVRSGRISLDQVQDGIDSLTTKVKAEYATKETYDQYNRDFKPKLAKFKEISKRHSVLLGLHKRYNDNLYDLKLTEVNLSHMDRVPELEGLVLKLYSKYVDADKLNALYVGLSTVHQSISLDEDLIKYASAADYLEDRLSSMQGIIAQLEQAISLNSDLEAALSIIAKSEIQFAALSGTDDIAPRVLKLEEMQARAISLRDLAHLLFVIEEDVASTTRDIAEDSRMEEEAEREYGDLLSSLGVCPVCGSKIG